jgi:hypothetical protein
MPIDVQDRGRPVSGWLAARRHGAMGRAPARTTPPSPAGPTAPRGARVPGPSNPCLAHLSGTRRLSRGGQTLGPTIRIVVAATWAGSAGSTVQALPVLRLRPGRANAAVFRGRSPRRTARLAREGKHRFRTSVPDLRTAGPRMADSCQAAAAGGRSWCGWRDRGGFAWRGAPRRSLGRSARAGHLG